MTDRIRRDADFVTIVGTNIAEIMREFHAQGLSGRQYSIVHRIGHHRFTMVEDEKTKALFDGQSLLAATFARHK